MAAGGAALVTLAGILTIVFGGSEIIGIFGYLFTLYGFCYAWAFSQYQPPKQQKTAQGSRRKP